MSQEHCPFPTSCTPEPCLLPTGLQECCVRTSACVGCANDALPYTDVAPTDRGVPHSLAPHPCRLWLRVSALQGMVLTPTRCWVSVDSELLSVQAWGEA